MAEPVPIGRAKRRREERTAAAALPDDTCQVNMCADKATERVGMFPRPGMLVVVFLCPVHAGTLQLLDQRPAGDGLILPPGVR